MPVDNKVAVLYIHGVGNDKAGFSEDLHDSVLETIALDFNWGHPVDADFVCREVCWFDVFQDQRSKLEGSLEAPGLTWTSARRFVLSTVAEAVAYENEVGNGAYEVVMSRVEKAIHELQKLAGKQAPLVIVAHSLGSVIASNYIWDRQRRNRDPLDNSPFEHLETLKLLVTMGSPLALYAGRWKDYGTPISMGSRKAVWSNLMAPADLLAWPLGSLNSKYSREVTEDATVKLGWFLGRTPASHVRYWKSSKVADKVSDLVGHVWKDMKRKKNG